MISPHCWSEPTISPEPALPGTIGGDHFCRSVVVGDFELGVENGTDAVLRQAHPAQSAGIPSVAEHDPQRILAGRDKAGDVEGLHHHAFGVIGPTRVELVVADAVAVDRRLVNPKSGCIQARPGNRTFRREILPQIPARPDGVVGVFRWLRLIRIRGGLPPARKRRQKPLRTNRPRVPRRLSRSRPCRIRCADRCPIRQIRGRQWHFFQSSRDPGGWRSAPRRSRWQ